MFGCERYENPHITYVVGRVGLAEASRHGTIGAVPKLPRAERHPSALPKEASIRQERRVRDERMHATAARGTTLSCTPGQMLLAPPVSLEQAARFLCWY